MSDAVNFLTNSLEGRPMKARIDAQDKDGLLWASLFDNEGDSYSKGVNADVVAEGHAMVPRKLKAWEREGASELKTLKELEQDARNDKRGMWEYGDPTAAED